MPNQAVLFGLVGTVFGAIIGAATSIYGPLIVHRRQAREARAVRQTASTISKYEAYLENLVALRASVRNWQFLLSATLDELARGRLVDEIRFRNECTAVRASIIEVIDEGTRDHMFAYQMFLELQLEYPHLVNEPLVDIPALGDALKDATEIVERCVEAGLPLRSDLRKAAERRLQILDDWRRKLGALIREQFNAIYRAETG